MINQLLNRDFILDQMRQARNNLALPASERRRGVDVPQEAKDLRIGEEDRQAALAALEGSLGAEPAEPSGQTPKFPKSGEEAPLDDWSFISSDPVISNLQTVLDYYLTDGRYELLPKKEVVKLERERKHLQANLAGIKNLNRLPDALFVIDSNKEQIAVKEARKLGIPVVAVVDTNCDPTEVDYIIPGNDDALRAIRLFASKIADLVVEGWQAVP